MGCIVRPPKLPNDVIVLPGTDIAGEWARFKSSEPLHHSHDICAPMSDEELRRVVERLGVGPGSSVLDIACGHGELLISISEQTSIQGTGVDLSP